MPFSIESTTGECKDATLATPQNVTDTCRSVSDFEKYSYVDAKRLSFGLVGLVSAVPLLFGLWMFAIHDALIVYMLPFVVLNAIYLCLSYGVMLKGSDFSLFTHNRKVADFRAANSEPVTDISIDVFLPVCGEDHKIIQETWEGVRDLEWSGTLNVYVLDDSLDDSLRPLVASFGFQYLRRDGNEFKKSGNLNHGLENSTGDYILLLDADFRPRSDMLRELIPYFTDSKLGILQTPQYFDVDHDMSWVQAGAGFVQELFYRLIQPARNRWDAAVCVGSCAVYRRKALDEVGGFHPIDHSEDIWTGFDVVNRGWKIHYVPLVFAKGICPATVTKFFTQQYRWCSGSLSLIGSQRFWTSSITVAQKLCYFSGLVYYLATAVNVFFTSLPPMIMVCTFPDLVRWYHLAFWILTLLYATLIMSLWSRHSFGFHFLSTREISAASHLGAVFDGIRGRMMSWVVTGATSQAKNYRLSVTLILLFVFSGLPAILVWIYSIRYVTSDPYRWVDFAPPAFFVSMQALICWRALTCPTVQTAILGHRTSDISEKWIARVERLFRTATKQSGLIQAVGIMGLACFVFGVTRYPKLSSQQVLTVRTSGVSPSGDSYWIRDQQPLSSFAEFGTWSVEEAFPGPLPIGGAVRLRPHTTIKDRYFIGANTGVIHQIDRNGGSWQAKPIVDLRNSSLEFLYSFELHPQFHTNSLIYLSYRTKKDRDQSYRVSVAKVPEDQSIQYGEQEVLIDQRITTSEHLGGDLAFDPSGFLLVSVGDNSESFEDIHSQRIDKALFSGILRLDVDQRGGNISHPPKRHPVQAKTSGYFIPNDNPFVGEPNALEEFWAIGLRNPFRMSVESVTNRSGTTDSTPYRVWIGEVGQDSLEQVEVASKGTNHLWSFQEGSRPFDQSYLNGRMPTNLHGRPVNAIYEYQHQDQNNCVVGGFIYEGEKFPELKGQYLFGDNQSGRVWAINPEEPDKAPLVLKLPFTKKRTSLVSIATDQNGDIFFTSFASWPPVYRLKRAHEFAPPKRLSETGLFSSLTELSPITGFTPYQVNVPLWSDGMLKHRWIRLPYGKKIDNESDNWKFPPGTVLIKHFEMPAAGPNSTPQKLETRILVTKEDGNVIGSSYLWNDDGSEALLQIERTTLSLPHPDGNGTFNYVLPGVNDCVTCHNKENPVLGFNAEQLNRDPDGLLKQNQLTSLSDAGFFAVPMEKRNLDKGDRLRSLDDENASLEEQARSYLHANCSFCHFPDAMQRVDIDLRAFTETSLKTLVDVKAALHYQEIDGEQVGWIIRSGSPNQSAIFRRMQTDDREIAMPYAGRTLIDQRALGVIEAWIQSLSP